MHQTLTRLLMLLCLGLLMPLAHAEFYKCKDLKGNISLQQTPCSGVGVTQTVLQDKPVNTYNDAALSAANQAKTGALKGQPAEQEDTSSLLSSVQNDPRIKSVVQPAKRKMEGLRTDKPLVFIAIVAFAAASVFFNLMLVFRAFGTSVFWGLGYLFVPLVALAYLFMHWDQAGKPFIASVACNAVFITLFLLA